MHNEAKNPSPTPSTLQNLLLRIARAVFPPYLNYTPNRSRGRHPNLRPTLEGNLYSALCRTHWQLDLFFKGKRRKKADLEPLAHFRTLQIFNLIFDSMCGWLPPCSWDPKSRIRDLYLVIQV